MNVLWSVQTISSRFVQRIYCINYYIHLRRKKAAKIVKSKEEHDTNFFITTRCMKNHYLLTAEEICRATSLLLLLPSLLYSFIFSIPQATSTNFVTFLFLSRLICRFDISLQSNAKEFWLMVFLKKE